MIETRRRWLLPERMRFLPRSRAMSIALRTLHLSAFGMLLGGHAFGVEADRLLAPLYLTIASGLGMMALEIYAVGLYWLLLGKGIMVLVKLTLLLVIPFFWEARVALLLLVMGIASVGSHMPARYRHYSFLHRGVIEPGQSLGTPVFSSPPQGVSVAVTIDEGRCAPCISAAKANMD
jgi:hypothetical protein